MKPLETFAEIGRLMFKVGTVTGEKLNLTVRTDGTYQIAAPDKALTFPFSDRDECLAFLQALDGDTTATRRAQRKAMRERALALAEKYAAEAASLADD